MCGSSANTRMYVYACVCARTLKKNEKNGDSKQDPATFRDFLCASLIVIANPTHIVVMTHL